MGSTKTKRKRQSQAATNEHAPALNLPVSDALVYNFETGDEEEVRYLSGVAMHRIGSDQDINKFTNLALTRGVEGWFQAISCATAMRERNFDPRSLDGQDVLAFLAKIYGVDDDVSVSSLPAPESTTQLRKKARKRKSRPHPDAENSAVEISAPVKKRKKAKAHGKGSGMSHYWAERSEPEPKGRGDDDNRETETEDRAEVKNKTAKRRKKTAAMKGKTTAPSESNSPASKRSIEQAGDNTQPEFLERAATPEVSQDRESAVSTPDCLKIQNADLSNPDIKCATAAAKQAHTTRKLQEIPEGGQKPLSDSLKPGKSPKRQAKSPYFNIPPATPKSIPSPPKRPRPPRGTVSALPFPRLDSPRFGLIQEELAHDPFRLLVAVTFLIRTTGRAAIPVFRALMARYPTPEALAAEENTADIVSRIRHLGLGVVRAAAIQRYARLWITRPPRKGVVYPVRGYGDCPVGDGEAFVKLGDSDDDRDGDSTLVGSSPPQTNNGGNEGRGERDCEDEDSYPNPTTTPATKKIPAWEIGHMTQGPYAIDSWRIFCRDVLRGVSEDWTGRRRRRRRKKKRRNKTSGFEDEEESESEFECDYGGEMEPGFQPEWMRVRPRDKELRACLRWMWMREGWLWDPDSGDKIPLPEDWRCAVQGGRVEYDDFGNLRIVEGCVGN